MSQKPVEKDVTEAKRKEIRNALLTGEPDTSPAVSQSPSILIKKAAGEGIHGIQIGMKLTVIPYNVSASSSMLECYVMMFILYTYLLYTFINCFYNIQLCNNNM